MGAPVRNFMVRGGADFSALYREMQKAKKHIASFRHDVKGSLAGIGQTLAALGTALFFNNAVQEAIKVEGAIDSINRLMGESANEFYDWAKTSANAFGMSKSEALDFGRTFSIMTSTFSRDSKDSLEMTTTLLEQSAVIASKSGQSMQEVMDRIASGLRGETESIQTLGIFTEVAMLQSTNAFKQFAGNKSWNQLSIKTQNQIRYFGILEQATKIYGNELSNTTGAKLNQFTASLKDLNLALGEAFTPILNVVLPSLTAFIQKISQAISFVAELSRVLFGYGTDQTKKQAKTLDAVATSYNNTGDAAKDAANAQKGFLAGFDEVNTLPDQKDTSGNGVEDTNNANGLKPNPDTGAGPIGDGFYEISEKAKNMAETIKTSLATAKDVITTAAPYIVIALMSIGTALVYIRREVIMLSVSTVVMGALSNGMKYVTLAVQGLTAAFAFLTGPVGLIIMAITAVAAACVYFYQTNETFRGVVDGIFTAIGASLKWLWENVLVPVGEFLAKTFVEAWDSVSEAAKWLWEKVLVPLGTVLWELASKIIDPLAVVMKETLGIAFQTVSDIAQSFYENVLVPLSDFFKDVFTAAIDTASVVLTALWEKVIKPFSDYLSGAFTEGLQAVINFIKDKFGPIFTKVGESIKSVWYNWLKPFAEYVAGAFKTVFKNAFTSIGDTIKTFKDIVIGILEFIKNVFKGDWEKAWQGLSDVVGNVFKALVNIVKHPINMIIDAVNGLIRGLNKISIDVPGWVPEFGGSKYGVNIPEIQKLARGGIVDSPTMAMVGEAGKEMVVPLENTSFVDKLAGALGTAVMSAMQVSNMNNTNNDKQVVIKIDGNTIARAINPYLTKESGRVGNSLIAIT